MIEDTPSNAPVPQLPALLDEIERACLVLEIARRDRRIDDVRAQITAEEAQQQQLRFQIDQRIGAMKHDVERLTAEITRLDARLERLTFARRPLSDNELDDEEQSERAEDAAFWAEWRQQRDERRGTIVNGRSRGDDQDSLRQVYRSLARLIHPDLASDPSDRVRREAVMRIANAAYEVGDADQLRRLLTIWSKPEAGNQIRDIQALRARVAERDVEESDLRRQLRSLQESQIGRLMRRPKAEFTRYVKREEERLRREVAGLRLRRRRLLTSLEERRQRMTEVSD